VEFNRQLEFLKYVKETSPALEAHARLRITIQAVGVREKTVSLIISITAGYDCAGADHQNVPTTIEQRRRLKVTYDGGNVDWVMQ
jgi:hypothetical protein